MPNRYHCESGHPKPVCLGKPSRRDGQNIAAGGQVKLKSRESRVLRETVSKGAEERRPMAHRLHERTCLTRYVVGLFMAWRGGRVVECSGLENRRTGNRSVSSNLTHAAGGTDLPSFPSIRRFFSNPRCLRQTEGQLTLRCPTAVRCSCPDRPHSPTRCSACRVAPGSER